MDAAAYIRVSTNKEEQELSLENQREFFEKYVGNRNDTLIRIYLSLIHISEPTRQPATSRMPSSA